MNRELESHISLLKLLPPSKTERHWIIPKGNTQLGWLPYTSQYVPIFSSKAPKLEDLNRLLEKNPYTSTVNFAMTVKNILEHSNEVGWNTDQQIEIFLLFCREHKPDLQAKLNVKKDSYVSFFKTLIYSCNQTAEISACRKFLRGYLDRILPVALKYLIQSTLTIVTSRLLKRNWKSRGL